MNIDKFVFSFDGEKPFFQNIAVDFEAHKLHIIMGDNGIGKSTFFNLLRGNINFGAKFEANIMFDEQKFETKNNRLPESFTFLVHTVRQDYNRMLADQFSVLENLKLANLGCYPNLKKLETPKLLSLLTSIGIELDAPVSHLSGGQKQLLAIVMALQKPTKLLLLDEPTATLDKQNSQMVLKFLQKLACELKITMLMICHDHLLVGGYGGGKIYCIEKGVDEKRVLRGI